MHIRPLQISETVPGIFLLILQVQARPQTPPAQEVLSARKAFDRGVQAEAADNLKDVEQGHLEAIQIYPTFSAAYHRLVLLYMLSGNQGLAIRCWAS